MLNLPPYGRLPEATGRQHLMVIGDNNCIEKEQEAVIDLHRHQTRSHGGSLPYTWA